MVQLKRSTFALTRRGDPRRKGNNPSAIQYLVMMLGGAAFGSVLTSYWVVVRSEGRSRLRRPGQQRIPTLSNTHNAVAMDVIKTLSCDDFSKEEERSVQAKPATWEGEEGGGNRAGRRRLDQMLDAGDDFGMEGQQQQERYGDDVFSVGGAYEYHKLTGRHLLCLAAGADNLPEWVTREGAFECDAAGTRRAGLLDAWSSIRAQIPVDILTKSLDLAVERKEAIKGEDYDLWAPEFDDGLRYTIDELNGDLIDAPNATQGDAIFTLGRALGKGKLFVDVGSNLGLSSILVTKLYPETSVISIEPAAPSWLIQQLNLHCILDPDSDLPHSILAGVGPKTDGMAKMMWRPTSTTSTRAWTLADERGDSDIELVVRLRKLRSIVAEAMPEELSYETPISVLNVDCEGCEYNLIPAMTEEEFDAIGIVIGGIHWGYIPDAKKPSSKRAATTHGRLCRHRDFARSCIECCAFPEQTVWGKESVTVKDVMQQGLCKGFDEWATKNQLFDVTDDYGWGELTSMTE